MRTLKFGDIADISVGKNRSRMSKEELDHLYTIEDMDAELASGEKEAIETIVLNALTMKAAPVIRRDAKKSIPATYMKCELKHEELINAWYLLYQLNESLYIRKEVEKLRQGTEALTKKINIADISQLEIPYVSFEQQEKIGSLYREESKRYSLAGHQSDLVHDAVMKVIGGIQNDE